MFSDKWEFVRYVEPKKDVIPRAFRPVGISSAVVSVMLDIN